MHHLNLGGFNNHLIQLRLVVLIISLHQYLRQGIIIFSALRLKSIVDGCIEITWISCFKDIIPANLLHRELKEAIFIINFCRQGIYNSRILQHQKYLCT